MSNRNAFVTTLYSNFASNNEGFKCIRIKSTLHDSKTQNFSPIKIFSVTRIHLITGVNVLKIFTSH